MSQPAATPRFKLIPALWTAGRRLRQRWSPLLAVALFLVASPAVLLAAIYVAGGAGWGAIAIGIAMGMVFTGFAGGTVAWLALAGGDDPWRVAIEGLSRSFYKLSPLAGFMLLVGLPSLLVMVLGRVTPRTLLPDDVARWVWWSMAWLGSLLPAVLQGLLAPVVGILLFEGGDLRPALGQAWRMTRRSRPKLILLQLASVLVSAALTAALVWLLRGLHPAPKILLTATTQALVTVLTGLVLNQAYFQLHANGD